MTPFNDIIRFHFLDILDMLDMLDILDTRMINLFRLLPAT